MSSLVISCDLCGQKLTSQYYLKSHRQTKKCIKKQEENKTSRDTTSSPRLDNRTIPSTIKDSSNIKESSVEEMIKKLNNLKISIDQIIKEVRTFEGARTLEGIKENEIIKTE